MNVLLLLLLINGFVILCEKELVPQLGNSYKNLQWTLGQRQMSFNEWCSKGGQGVLITSEWVYKFNGFWFVQICTSFLGMFAKLRKEIISFVFVCLSARMEQFGSHLKDFRGVRWRSD